MAGQMIDFWATFKAGTGVLTNTALNKPVYISASNTVSIVTTSTNYAIGTVKEEGVEAGGAVAVDLFGPIRKVLASDVITAGGRIAQDGAGFKDAVTASAAVPGIAITGASAANYYADVIIVPGIPTVS